MRKETELKLDHVLSTCIVLKSKISLNIHGTLELVAKSLIAKIKAERKTIVDVLGDLVHNADGQRKASKVT